jgi:hypothetical protein
VGGIKLAKPCKLQHPRWKMGLSALSSNEMRDLSSRREAQTSGFYARLKDGVDGISRRISLQPPRETP